MAALAQSLVVSAKDPQVPMFSGFSSKATNQCLLKSSSVKFTRHSTSQRSIHQNRFIVQARYSDSRRPNNAGTFIGGFILGGLVVGALGCFYAPQISKAIAGADRKDLMKKLPKFIYDEDKALERTRKVLTEKIEQLNSAIDGVSSQLHANDAPNGAPVASDEMEAAI